MLKCIEILWCGTMKFEMSGGPCPLSLPLRICLSWSCNSFVKFFWVGARGERSGSANNMTFYSFTCFLLVSSFIALVLKSHEKNSNISISGPTYSKGKLWNLNLLSSAYLDFVSQTELE